MQVQNFSTTPQLPRSVPLQGSEPAENPPPPTPPGPPEEKWDSVTFDKATKTYHFERPGHHYSAQVLSPVSEGLVGAALFGVPSAFGAVANTYLGGLGGTAATAVLGPTLGAVIGGVGLGRGAWKETNHNPIFTGLAALAGAGVGAVAFPLLSLPGTWGGIPGAAVAVAGAGIGAAVWASMKNQKLHQKALDAGYKPQG